MSYNSLSSDTIYLEIPQVKGSVHQDFPHPLQAAVISPGWHLHFWLSGCWPEIPKMPSLGGINSLELLTELRKPTYSLDHRFPMKGYNSGTARWKRCRGAQDKVWGKDASTPFPGLNPPHSSMCSPARKLSEPCPFGFLWWLYYTGIIDYIISHWWLNSISSPSPLPGVSGWDGGSESSNPLITCLTLLATSPYPKMRSKSHLVNVANDTFVALIT